MLTNILVFFVASTIATLLRESIVGKFKSATPPTEDKAPAQPAEGDGNEWS